MSPPGRPEGEYRSAELEGIRMSPARPPEGAHPRLAGPAEGRGVPQ
jgi:hypothetical protein